ncbi:CHAT domain-containing protein [Rhizobium sp. 2YAF20]|uniref:CHAT domain-containing protein n=1 Tax=Rhizobium sp. 2YAF20 TaxID=3233027 RepID=UPI003F9A278B
METIDADDIPLGAIVDQLLSPNGLHRLIGDRTIACFAIVRSAIAPAFFEELIRNVETIDATMRQHVAFIVFHGKESSILRRHPHCSAYFEHHIDGLSMSQGFIKIEERQDELQFNDELTDAVRLGASRKTNSIIAKATEVAVSHLATRFGILEASMPCLVFVNGTDLEHPVVIPLARRETMKSLYSDALGPISDEFRLVERHWRLKWEIKWHICGQRQAAEAIETNARIAAPLLAKAEALDRAREEFDDPETENGAKVRYLNDEIAALKTFCSEYQGAENLDTRVAVLATSEGAASMLTLQQQLRAAEVEKKAAFRADMTEDERRFYKAAASHVNRLRGELGAATRKPYDAANARLRDLESEIRLFDRSKADIESAIRAVRKNLDELAKSRTQVEATIAKAESFKLSEKRLELEQSEKTLLSRGYSPGYLQWDTPPKIDVVRLLLERGEIGSDRNRQRHGKKSPMLKILFLAANPASTGSYLDLEEELRAVELELRAVKFRDNISLVSKHAVRADDLVRYLREEKPDVLHFSGHGSPGGIIVRDDTGAYRSISGTSLATLLRDRGVKLVVLNSCYSDAQAGMIDTSVPAVVGTTDAVDDEAARRFSVAFYRTLGNGHALADAFRDGRDAVELHALTDVFQIRGDGSVVYMS